MGPLPFLECAYRHLSNKLIILLQGTELTDGICAHFKPLKHLYLQSTHTNPRNGEEIEHAYKSVQNKPQKVVGGDELNTWWHQGGISGFIHPGGHLRN